MLILLGATLILGAFACSVILCWLMRKLALRIGYVDHPGTRKIHARPIALGGGVGIVFSTIFLLAGGTLAANYFASAGIPRWMPDILSRHIPMIVARSFLIYAIAGGGFVLFLVGLIDDIRGLGAGSRLLVEALVALALCMASERLRVTAFSTSLVFSYVITILWIVGITNSFNLLDNMDGLSAGVAFVASGAFLFVAILTQQYFIASFLLVFMGALLGFLVFNFPPASMFMGDAGSMFIGYMLSLLTVLFTFYLPNQGQNPVAALFIPLVILAVPLYDTISVIVIRFAEKRPIFQGDTCHFSHRLVGLGMTHRQAILTICLVALCTGLLAPLLLKASPLMAVLVLLSVTLMLVLIWLLEHVGRVAQKNGKTKVEVKEEVCEKICSGK